MPDTLAPDHGHPCGAVVQIATFVLVSASRFLLYSSLFTMVGTLFTYKNFGRIVAVISIFAGVVGLCQLGLTHLAVNDLHRNFLPVQIAAAVWTSVLFIPAVGIYLRERKD
jgi:glutamate 5-kinase